MAQCPNQLYYLNDVVCREHGDKLIFGRVGKPLHYETWADVRNGFQSNFTIHWDSELGEIGVDYLDSNKNQLPVLDRTIKLGSKVFSNGVWGKVVKAQKVAYAKPVGDIGESEAMVVWEVNGDNLFPLERAFPGRLIYYKDWIGIITDVKRVLMLQCPSSGQICSLPLSPTPEREPSDYYWDKSFRLPGERFTLNLFSAYQATWDSGTFTWLKNLASCLFKNLGMAVLGTKTETLTVQWIGLVNHKRNSHNSPMAPVIVESNKFNDLQYLDVSPTTHVKPLCYRRYNLAGEDELIPMKEWKNRILNGREYKPTQASEIRQVDPNENGVIVEVILTRNLVTVLWEDGRKSTIYAGSIEKFHDAGKEYRAHAYPRFIVNRIIAEEQDEGYGFVKSYDYDLGTYLVDWYKYSAANGWSLCEEREVAKFDTEAHPVFQKLTKNGQLVVKSLDSRLAFFEVGVVIGVHEGKILVFGSDEEEYSFAPNDLAPFAFMTSWDNETQSWQIEPESDSLVGKESGLGLKRIDSAKEFLSQSRSKTAISSARFCVLERVPESHHFLKNRTDNSDSSIIAQITESMFPRDTNKSLAKRIQKEIAVLRDSLPEGIWVKGYEDRMDLLSVMIEGPEQTPYEGYLFFFDVKIPSYYPSGPPLLHFISWSPSLNPNLYVDGKVCLSLLGTWEGHEEENWSPASTLLQVLVSIQGLVLVSEPYFNEPGYASSIGTEEGIIDSAVYNAEVLINCLDSCLEMISRPLDPWKDEIARHNFKAIPKINEKLKALLQEKPDSSSPGFNIFPLKRDIRLAIGQRLERLDHLMASLDVDLSETQISSP